MSVDVQNYRKTIYWIGKLQWNRKCKSDRHRSWNSAHHRLHTEHSSPPRLHASNQRRNTRSSVSTGIGDIGIHWQAGYSQLDMINVCYLCTCVCVCVCVCLSFCLYVLLLAWLRIYWIALITFINICSLTLSGDRTCLIRHRAFHCASHHTTRNTTETLQKHYKNQKYWKSRNI